MYMYTVNDGTFKLVMVQMKKRCWFMNRNAWIIMEQIMEETIERFLRYIQIDTQSDPDSGISPSSKKQHKLAQLLYKELVEMGAADVYYDTEHCYVYAKIPASAGKEDIPVIGFISHMDTSPDSSGADIKPRMIGNYDGNDIILNEEKGIILDCDLYSDVKLYIGKRIIVTDGTTLLGADDKAGIAEIMTMTHYLLTHPEIEHGTVVVVFTPDEEIGKGTLYFDLDRFGADYAYTVDAGGASSLEFETFNAASAQVHITGVSCHTGEAKSKMKNAMEIAMEYHRMIPAEQKPEFTDNREGFFHIQSMNGTVVRAELAYLIRDFDRKNFENRKKWLLQCAEFINKKYGENTICINLEDTYYNMREIIEPTYMHLIEKTKKCMSAMEMDADISPIRGGTDGAMLTLRVYLV